ncbi:MAG: hypothetical protein AABY09_04890, partial [Nanoarchaeota archaeon]
MTFNGFMKAVAGLSGSLMMTLGITIIFLGMVLINVEKNVDRLDESVRVGFTEFVENNKEDVRQIALDQMESENKNVEFKKEDIVTACSNRAALNEDAKKLITDDFCSKVTAMTDEEVRNAIVDNMIDSNKDKFVEQMASSGSSEQVRQPVMGIKSLLGGFMAPIAIGLALAIIGMLLTFVSVGFILLDGSYKATSKLAVNLAS